MSDEKKYTADEVAKKVLEAAHNVLKKSELAKANSAHEVENGEEPRNDDAEAPEYLANADIEGDGERKAKKKNGESEDEASDKHEDEPAHEEDMDAQEEKEHDAAENEADEKDADDVEADEETAKDDAEAEDTKKVISDAAKDPEDKMKKSEKGVDKLKGFLAKMEPTRMATAQESPEVADRQKQTRMITPKERKDLDAAKKMKTKKVEKMLGMQQKVPQQKPQEPPKMPSGNKGY